MGPNTAICSLLNSPCAPSDPLFFHRNVNVQPSGATMEAVFVPDNGCTLQAVANAAGYFHFNWTNLVIQAPQDLRVICGAQVPFFDPLPGRRFTCPAGWSDDLVYIWNEVNEDGTVTNTELDQWTAPYQLRFKDVPSWGTLNQNNTITFVTALVGVRPGRPPVPLSVFTWQTTYNGTAGGVTTLKNTADADPGTGSGGVTVLARAAGCADLPLNIREFLAASGFDVPTTPDDDETPPVITPLVSGIQGANQWYRSNVSVTWSVADPESSIGSSSGCDSTELASDTAGVTLTCSATNGAGLVQHASIVIKIDKTAPIVDITSPAAGASYLLGAVVPSSYTCLDALSGIATCAAVVDSGIAIDASVPGQNHLFTVAASDFAGNTTTSTRSSTRDLWLWRLLCAAARASCHQLRTRRRHSPSQVEASKGDGRVHDRLEHRVIVIHGSYQL